MDDSFSQNEINKQIVEIVKKQQEANDHLIKANQELFKLITDYIDLEIHKNTSWWY